MFFSVQLLLEFWIYSLPYSCFFLDRAQVAECHFEVMVRTSNPYDVSPQGTLVGNLVPLWNVYFGLALQVGNVDVSIVKLLYATS